MESQKAGINIVQSCTYRYPIYWIPSEGHVQGLQFQYQYASNLKGDEKFIYHATESQLECVKSQLLYVLSSGNWDASFEICEKE